MSGTTIDDADPAVVYSGNWAGYSGLSTSYKGTRHESTTLNDRATLSFQGIGILVSSGQQGVGWRVRSSYAIDGGSPTVYSNDSYQSTTEAYRSPTLPNGQHTLTVINLDNRAALLFLDSFLVFTPDDTQPTSSSSSSSTTSLTRATTSSTSVSLNSDVAHSGTNTSTPNAVFPAPAITRSSASSRPDATSTPSPSSATKPRDSNQILLIVAPISGAIVICGIIFFLLRRRRKQKQLTSPTSFDSIRSPPVMQWANGQKPSSLAHNSNEPPPYVQDAQPASHLFTPDRRPAKFRTQPPSSSPSPTPDRQPAKFRTETSSSSPSQTPDNRQPAKFRTETPANSS